MIGAGISTPAPPNDIDGRPRPMIRTSGELRFDIGADERKGPVA